jgi:general stress protein YciG
MTKSSGKAKKGFAAMDPAKQREIASKGGRSSHGWRSQGESHRGRLIGRSKRI